MSHEQGGPTTKETVTVACIMDCPTIKVHAGKCYKALIDSGAAISLIRYSTYQLIDDSFKTSIQPTNTKLNTVDGSPTMALGMTALHLRIADFKFTHNFSVKVQIVRYKYDGWLFYVVLCLFLDNSDSPSIVEQ